DALDGVAAEAGALEGETKVDGVAGVEGEGEREVGPLEGLDVADAEGGVAAGGSVADGVVLEDEEGVEEGSAARELTPGLDVWEGGVLVILEEGLFCVER